MPTYILVAYRFKADNESFGTFFVSTIRVNPTS